MSIEIIRLTDEGVTTVAYEDTTDLERMNIDLGLTLGRMQMLCAWCSKEIPSGNACYAHRNERSAFYNG